MAFNINKLPFIDQLLTMDYSLTLNQKGISEDGEPLKAITKRGKCIFSEKSKTIIDGEGKQTVLLGKVIIKGDIAPSLKTINDGTITINASSYEIHAASRPRNPDGTIHHTVLEVK